MRKTSELSGTALDWAVAKAEGLATDLTSAGNTVTYNKGWGNWEHYSPSTDWKLAGPIIERERMEFDYNEETKQYSAYDGIVSGQGDTHLIAAMRCFALEFHGEAIEIPEGLT